MSPCEKAIICLNGSSTQIDEEDFCYLFLDAVAERGHSCAALWCKMCIVWGNRHINTLCGNTIGSAVLPGTCCIGGVNSNGVVGGFGIDLINSQAEVFEMLTFPKVCRVILILTSVTHHFLSIKIKAWKKCKVSTLKILHRLTHTQKQSIKQ